MTYTDHIFEGYHRRLADLESSTNPFARGIAWVGDAYVPVAGDGAQEERGRCDDDTVPKPDPRFQSPLDPRSSAEPASLPYR